MLWLWLRRVGYTYLRIYIYTYIHAYIYIYIHSIWGSPIEIDVCVCVYIHIYVYTLMYTNVYIYIHLVFVYSERELARKRGRICGLALGFRAQQLRVFRV